MATLSVFGNGDDAPSEGRLSILVAELDQID